jgi:hypothetical protein
MVIVMQAGAGAGGVLEDNEWNNVPTAAPYPIFRLPLWILGGN